MILSFVVMGACSGSSDDEAGPSTTIAGGGTTGAATTTVVSSATTTSSTLPATNSTTPETCSVFGSFDLVSAGFPERLTGATGIEVRTGAHACFDRVVVEFGDGAVPGHRVGYADDPIPLGETDDQFVELAGDANLVIEIAAPMGPVDEPWGQRSIRPENVTHVEELYLTRNFEGLMTWVVGVDERRSFRVTVLDAPARLVIDFATR